MLPRSIIEHSGDTKAILNIEYDMRKTSHNTRTIITLRHRPCYSKVSKPKPTLDTTKLLQHEPICARFLERPEFELKLHANME
jgi:hypothetical protein